MPPTPGDSLLITGWTIKENCLPRGPCGGGDGNPGSGFGGYCVVSPSWGAENKAPTQGLAAAPPTHALLTSSGTWCPEHSSTSAESPSPAYTAGSLPEVFWAGAGSPHAHSVLPDCPLCWGSPAGLAGSLAREGNGWSKKELQRGKWSSQAWECGTRGNSKEVF